MRKSVIILSLLLVSCSPHVINGKKVEQLKTFYICPMHPEIRQEQPGTCPKCGMALIEEVSNSVQLQSSDPQLKTNYVCMMNNKFFGVEQIAVEVEGKTYYGCCQGCVQSLKNNRAIRYATDPYSNEEVDKANAYIVLNPDNPQTVLYFKSSENYVSYLNQKSK